MNAIPSSSSPKSWQYITFFLALLVLWILKPFLLTIITSILFAYIFYPLYKVLQKGVKKKGFAAFLTTLIIVIAFVLPVASFLLRIQPYTVSFYQQTKSFLETLPHFCAQSTHTDFICQSYLSLQQNTQIGLYLSNAFDSFVDYLLTVAKSFVLSLPQLLLKFFVFFFLLYYFLKDGQRIIAYSIRYFPFSQKKRRWFLNQLKDMLNGILYGSIIVALIQATFATIGFYLVGTIMPVLLGILTFFFVFIPFLGATAIWLPVGLIFLLQQEWVKGIIILLYGFFIISSSDNILKPLLIAEKTKLHPMVTLLGILGGLAAFGFVGVFLGPLLIGLFLLTIESLKK